MSLEQDLRRGLHEGAGALQLDGEGPEGARRRAHRIARRRRAIPATFAVAAIAGGGVAALVRREEPKSSVVVGENGAGGQVVESDLAWREAETALVTPRQLVHGDDGYTYALSTAPGTRYEDHPDGAVPQALYRSADGENWETVELGEKPWMSDLDERGGVLYALGTGPATRAGVDRDIIAAVSDDGGATWNDVTLPSTAAPPEIANANVQRGYTQAKLVAGNDSIVATLRTDFYLDGDQLLTAEERASDYYTVQTEVGLDVVKHPEVSADCAELEAGTVSTPVPGPTAPDDVIAPDGLCVREARDMEVVRTIPWSDLGLSGPQDLHVDEMFVSTDGQAWDAVESPFTDGAVTDLVAAPDGFVAATVDVGVDGAGGQLWHSADGRSWNVASDGLGYVDRVGIAGSRLIAVRAGDASAAVMTSGDGGRTWTSTDLASVAGVEIEGIAAVGAFDAGPLGVAVVISDVGAVKEPTATLLTSADGVNWSVTSLSEIAGQDAGGAWVDWVHVGENDVTVTVSSMPNADGHPWKTFVGTPAR